MVINILYPTTNTDKAENGQNPLHYSKQVDLRMSNVPTYLITK